MNVLPALSRSHARMPRRSRAAASALAAGLILTTLAWPNIASATTAINPNQIGICHTGNGKNFVAEHPAKTADAGGHAYLPKAGKPNEFQGHEFDIIPPFHYDGPPAGEFPGQNWDVIGQETWNNECEDVVPDLVMLKTGTPTATVGDNGSYSLSVRNDGTAILRQMTVTDTLPAGVVLQALPANPSGSGWDCTRSTTAPQVSCTQTALAAGLAAGATSSVITVPVTFQAASVGTATDSAHVATLTGEKDTSDNTATYNTLVAAAPLPDLRVGKTGPATAVAGDTGSYVLTVYNTGAGTGTGQISLTDTVPAGVTIGTIDVTSGFSCGTSLQVITCTTDTDLAPVTLAASAMTVTVHVTFAGSGLKTNSVDVSSHDDSNTGNNNATAATNVTAAPVPDLRVGKTGPATAVAGDTGSYVLTVYNTGAGTEAGQITLTDTVPAGVTIGTIDVTSGFSCGTSLQVITCTTDTDLAPVTLDASTMTVTVHVTFAASGTKTNSVDVSSNDDSLTNNNNATAVTEVIPATPDPTAVVTKTNNADGDQAFNTDEVASVVGSPVPFKLHITNTSPYAVDVTTVWDAVGAAEGPGSEVSCVPGLTLAAVGTAGDSGDCFFTMDSYSPADGAVKTDVATVLLTKHTAPVVTLRRLAAAVLASPPSVLVVSNASTVRTTLPRVAAVAPTVIPSVCSNGVATAPSYTVPTTTGVVYSPTSGSTGVPGTSTVVTAVAAPGYVLSNPGASPFTVAFGSAASCGGTPPPPVVLPSPPAPPVQDLGLSKTGPGSAQPGDELVWTLVVTNVKGTPATGFTVADTLPAGLSFSGAGGLDFTCTNAGPAISCLYTGSLPANQSAAIVVRALLDSAYQATTVSNTAVVDPGRFDDNATDNTSTAVTDITAATPTQGGVIVGGEAGGPVTAPAVSPPPVASGGPQALPFSGSYTRAFLQAGAGMLVLGLFLGLIARRRRVEAD